MDFSPLVVSLIISFMKLYVNFYFEPNVVIDYLISPILDFLDFSFFSTGLAYTSSPFVSFLFSLY
jgi:hypothetical protein